VAIKEINAASGNKGFKGPLLLTGFLMSCLRQHFFTPDGIFDDALKDILWQPEDTAQGTTDTKIYIDYKLKAKPPQSNFRNAILLARGKWNRVRVAQYDRNGLGDVLYGDKIDKWEGSHTFTCLAKTYATAEILAHEVATFFEVYGQLLAQQICLIDLFVTDISEPSLIPEDSETYSVTVSVHYQHNNSWSLKELRPKIRHIRPLITVQDYEGKFEPKTSLIDIDYNGDSI
jgi:hypothetical protein